MTYPWDIGKQIGGAVKSVTPKVLPWLAGAAIKRGIPALGAGYLGYQVGKGIMAKLQPQDWYYNPTPETQAKQFGIAQMSPYAQSVFARPGVGEAGIAQPKGATVAGGTQTALQSYIQAQQALPQGGQPKAGGIQPLKPMSYEEAQAMAQRLGSGYYMEWDEETGGYKVDRDPRYFAPPAVAEPPPAMGEYQKGQLSLAERQMQQEQATAAQKMAFEQQQFSWQQQQAQAEEARRQTTAETEQRQWEQQMQMEQQKLEWQRQSQQMELESEKQRELARLSAQPRSWLEYSALKGEAPSVQPWMLPLSYQQYGWQAGSQLPTNYQNLPELMNPSAQYQARLSPSQTQQLYGYEQARTGQTPEDVAWRYGQTTAPSGGGGGLRWLR